MKMSKEIFEMFNKFYKTTVKEASDDDVKFIMTAIHNAAAAKVLEKQGVKKEYINPENPRLNKSNANEIRRFFEDFIAKANDDEALYLMDGINEIMNYWKEHPKDVAKYVIARKKAMLKELEKEEKAMKKAD